jgi:L-histidine N-alpha-methyltransferase
MLADAVTGLQGEEKSIPPVWFYDERGSRLFEEITQLPEYYPTRAERALLEKHAPAIAEISKADTLVELGAGACDKTRVLLSALQGAGTLARYVPFDVSDGFLRDAATTLSDEFGTLDIHLVIGDFHRHLAEIPTEGRRMVAFLGGTIGNLDPAQRARFLFDLNCTMSSDDSLLLGTDLVKDRGRLVAAYDDAAGVTADFNRNVLHVLNEQLGGDFDPTHFRHVALWNEEEQWIEMRLRAEEATEISLAGAGITVRFDEGEDLLTEISAKFTPDKVKEELYEAGFVVEDMWGADEGEFLLTLAHPFC